MQAHTCSNWRAHACTGMRMHALAHMCLAILLKMADLEKKPPRQRLRAPETKKEETRKQVLRLNFHQTKEEIEPNIYIF